MNNACPYGYYSCHFQDGKWFHRDDCWNQQYEKAVQMMRDGAKELDRIEAERQQQDSQ